MVCKVCDNTVVVRGIYPCKSDSLELNDLAGLLYDAPLAETFLIALGRSEKALHNLRIIRREPVYDSCLLLSGILKGLARILKR